MQIIEQTGFGVRSAVITLKRREGGPTFVLFPMLHVASPKFYAEVQRRLAECDVVVVEGVGGRRVRIITSVYTILGGLRRSGLELQSRGLNLKQLSATIIRPDLSAKEFSSVWRTVSLPLRALVYIAAPLLGVWAAIVGPRRAFGSDLELGDLPTLRQEELAHDDLDHAFLKSRDAPLIAALYELVDSSDSVPAETIGVLWGAGHMPAVARALHARGFIPRGGEWVMAIPPKWHK